MSHRLSLAALAVASLIALPAWAEPSAPPPSTAQHVTITLSNGDLPDPEAIVQALERPGGQHQVRVQVRKTADARALTLDLWGNSVEDAQVEPTLVDAFPVLRDASIAVSRIDAAPPKVEADQAGDGEQVIIKKKIIRKTRESK